MISIALAGLNLCAAFVFLCFGTKVERAIVAAIIAYISLPPLIYTFQIDTFRYGIFVLELALLSVFVVGGVRADRWWLILATGTQVIVCLTHIVGIKASIFYEWSAITLRLGLWALITLILLLGAWETWSRRIGSTTERPIGEKLEV